MPDQLPLSQKSKPLHYILNDISSAQLPSPRLIKSPEYRKSKEILVSFDKLNTEIIVNQ